jgi:hypothetical protein
MGNASPSIEILILIFLAVGLLFRADMGLFAYIIYSVSRPVLLLIVIGLVFRRCIMLIMMKPGIRKHHFFKGTLYIFLISALLLSCQLLSTEIVYFRQILYFNSNKDGFHELESLAPLMPCYTPGPVSCDVVVQLPVEGWRGGDNVRTLSFEGNFALLLSNRGGLSYAFIPEQPQIPNGLSMGRYKLSCSYQLAGDWYICSIGT